MHSLVWDSRNAAMLLISMWPYKTLQSKLDHENEGILSPFDILPRQINAEKQSEQRAKEVDNTPKKDYSLKEGQTINISIGNVGVSFITHTHSHNTYLVVCVPSRLTITIETLAKSIHRKQYPVWRHGPFDSSSSFGFPSQTATTTATTQSTQLVLVPLYF